MIDTGSFASALLGIAMLGFFVLLWGAWRIWRGGDARKAGLMLAVAVILLGNVLVWTL